MGRKKKVVKEMEQMLDQKKINAFVFSAIQSKYDCKNQQEANEIIAKKKIYITNIVDDGLVYVSIFKKPYKLIAQRPLYYFINQDAYANKDPEANTLSGVLSEGADHRYEGTVSGADGTSDLPGEIAEGYDQ